MNLRINFTRAGLWLCLTLLSTVLPAAGAEPHRVESRIVDLYLGNDWLVAPAAKVGNDWMRPDAGTGAFQMERAGTPEQYAAGNVASTEPVCYRQTVAIPEEWAGKDYNLELSLPVGAELFIDGKAIPVGSERTTVLPLAELIPAGSEAVVAVRQPAGIRRLYLYRNLIRLARPELRFGRSVPLPTVNVPVTLHRLSGNAPGLTVTAPSGKMQQLLWDGGGNAVWRPDEYGWHDLSDAGGGERVFVTARPLILHLWDGAVYSFFATSVMGRRDDAGPDAYRERGTRIVSWAGGEYMGRDSQGAAQFLAPRDWVEYWTAATLPGDGLALDEIYLGNDEKNLMVCQATAQFRRIAPKDFEMGVYFCGIEPDALAPGWTLRSALGPNMLLFQECYSFAYPVWQQRWSAVLMQRFEDNALLSLATGMLLGKAELVDNATYTPEKLDETVAFVRRIAPFMAGLSFFNAYNRGDLDAQIDAVFEKYFLQPVLYCEPHRGKVRVWNIGQTDAAGASAVFVAADGTELGGEALPELAPYRFVEVAPPAGCIGLGLAQPENRASLYRGNLFRLPADLDPLQVVSVSIDNAAVLARPDGRGRIVFRFSKAPAPESLKPENVMLTGVASGAVPVETAYHEASHSLIVSGEWPEDCYSLFLKGGENGIRAADGSRLDGSGNGLIEGKSESSHGEDEYPLYFRFTRRLDCPAAGTVGFE